MLRHLLEVMQVLEGKQPWAMALRDRRRNGQQGVPLPSVTFNKDNGSIDSSLRELLIVMMERMDKELTKLIVSFV